MILPMRALSPISSVFLELRTFERGLDDADIFSVEYKMDSISVLDHR